MAPILPTPPRSWKPADLYVKGDKQYEVAGKNYAQDWSNTPSSHLFPRMYYSRNDRSEIDTFTNDSSGMDEGDVPNMGTRDNKVKYFLRYQTGWMYLLRYFMWNFAGKQNDLQGFGNPRDSNWISGIPVLRQRWVCMAIKARCRIVSIRTTDPITVFYLLPSPPGHDGTLRPTSPPAP